MNIKIVILAALTSSYVFTYAEDAAKKPNPKNSSSFQFKEFKDEDECLNFIKYLRKSGCPVKHTIALLACIDNKLKSCPCGCYKGFNRKFKEAIEYLKAYEPDSAEKDEELMKASSFVLGLTLNPAKALAPEEFEKESTINADVALYLLDKGANPRKKGIRRNITFDDVKQAKHLFSSDVKDKDDDDEEYVTFEEFVDALYEGSEKLPQIKSRNCSSWNPFCKDPECKKISEVRSKIKELNKESKSENM